MQSTRSLGAPGPRARPGPLIMAPGAGGPGPGGAIRRRLLIAKPQYIENREVPVWVRRAPHAALVGLNGESFETKSW